MRIKDAVNKEKLIAWLRTKDPNEEFEYDNTQECCICQYIKAQGFSGVNAGGNYVRVNNSFAPEGIAYLPEWRNALISKTFGEVLEKLS